MISQWLFWIGVVCAALGLLLLSPLADYLPIDLWLQLKQLFSGEQAPHRTYLRIVHTEPNRTIEFIILSVGIVMIASSFFLKTSR